MRRQSRLRTWLAGLAALGLLFAARTALACPACAARDEAGGPALFAVYAAMVIAPFVAAGVVIRLVRSMDRNH